MAILGVRAAVDLVTPTGIDAEEIFKFTVLRDGKMTAGELIQQVAALIGRENANLMAKYGGLMYITEDMYGETRQGETSRSMTPVAAEFTESDAVRSSTIGNMLPLEPYEDALGWSRRYLLNARRAQVRADMELIVERWRNRFDYNFVTRILTDTENAIGDNGYDVGWAIGTGDNVNYIPPQWREKIFTSAHTHYDYLDDDSYDWGDLMNNMALDLREHGYSGRLALWCSEDDIDEFEDLTKFVELIPPTVTVVAGNSSAPIYTARGEFEGVPGELFGYYKGRYGLIELRYHGRIPTNYCWMTKPAGMLNPANPVAIRVHPDVAFGLAPDPQLTRSINPKLEKVLFNAEFGTGVNDRLAGVAGYLASGAVAWVNPTIT